MGNHLYLIVRLGPDVVADWSQLQVARHAFAMLPIPLDVLYPSSLLQGSREHVLAAPEQVQRLAGKRDFCRGTDWDGDF